MASAETVLDIGCGDGHIAATVMAVSDELSIRGIDVLVRPETEIPVGKFDGSTIPFEDNSFDLVSFVDVLHHTDNAAELLQEANRVARNGVVIKDHLLEGIGAGVTLRFMDWVGNERHGVALPYNYMSRGQWDEAFAIANLEPKTWHGTLGLYPFPASLLFDRTLHFVSLLTSKGHEQTK